MSQAKQGRALAAWVLIAGLATACAAGFSCSPSKGKPPNVVLVVVDALRPDYLGCYGCDRPTSPSIDNLAAEGILFETAISHASWTKPSFSTILTSLYPFQHGVVDWESVMPESLVTLAEVLDSGGYATAAVINMLGLTGEYKVTKGFAAVNESAKRQRDAMGTTDDAMAFIKESSRPFFVMVHYFDAHWPRRPPSEYVDLVRREGDPNPFAAVAGGARPSGEPGPELVEREKVLYAACVRYVDDAVGKLVEFLDQSGLGRETLLVVTADHGEAFWEHGTGSHGANLYDEVVRVPLVVRYPSGCKPGGRVAAQVRQVDLLPTIVDYAGVPDRHHREGTSLRRLLSPGAGGGSREARPVEDRGPTLVPSHVALSETRLKKAPETRGLRTEALKLIVEPATGLRELYDLKSDPGERLNLWGSRDSRADSLGLLLGRVPGSSVNGWRVAVTGDTPRTGLVLEIIARVDRGGRIGQVHTVTAPGAITIEAAPDSASLRIVSRPEGLQMLLFDVEPEGAEVTFEARSEGGAGPAAVQVGETGSKPLGKPFVVYARAGVGLPLSFQEARGSLAPSVCVWWLPGDKIGEAGGRAVLSTDAKRRLRALGYVQ